MVSPHYTEKQLVGEDVTSSQTEAQAQAAT
jgi:hypothetical protein